MRDVGLTMQDIKLIRGVFRRFLAISEVVPYGPRAKGTYRPESDIDLALIGVEDELQAEASANALEDLPLPYQFDVKPYSNIKHVPLQEHIVRLDVSLYRRDSSTKDTAATKPITAPNIT